MKYMRGWHYPFSFTWFLLLASCLLLIGKQSSLVKSNHCSFFFVWGKKSDHKSTMLNMRELWHAGFSLVPTGHRPTLHQIYNHHMQVPFFITGSSFFWFSIKCLCYYPLFRFMKSGCYFSNYCWASMLVKRLIPCEIFLATLEHPLLQVK